MRWQHAGTFNMEVTEVTEVCIVAYNVGKPTYVGQVQLVITLVQLYILAIAKDEPSPYT